MKRVSNSELRTFKECKRRWYMTYYRRLKLRRESPTGAASVGTRVHACLQAHYSPDPSSSAMPLELHDILVDLDLREFPEEEATIRKEADLSRAMLEGYFDWLQETGADEGLIPISAEKRLEYEMPGGVVLQGKLDVRVQRDTDGAILVVDHKTCQDFSIAHGLARDEQIKTYLLLAKLALNGERVDGAVFNMLRKVKRTASAKPPFYDRAEIRHNDHVLRDFFDRVCQEIADIQELERALDRGETWRAYPNPTKDCKWRCPFVGVCALMDDPTARAEQMIEALYEEGDPYQRYLDAGE